MSVESDIDAALALVRTQAAIALNDASALAKAVADGIDKPLAEVKQKISSDFNAPELTAPAELPRPPTPRNLEVALPESPTRQLNYPPTAPVALKAKAPTLNLPKFLYALPDAPEQETVTAPTLGPRPALPTVPVERLGAAPIATPPRWITLTPAQADAPPIPAPSPIDVPAVHFTSEFDAGLAYARAVLPADWGGMAALAGLDAAAFSALERRLRGDLDAAAFDAGYAWRRYAQQRRAQSTEDGSARATLDQQTQDAGLAIPGGPRWSGESDLERSAANASVDAAVAIHHQILDAEQAVAAQTLTLIETLITGSVEMRFRAAELALQGFEEALRCGEAALGLALEALELKRKELTLFEAYYRLQQQRLDLLRKSVQNYADVVQENVQQSLLQSKYNAILSKQQTIQWNDIKRRVRLQVEQQDAIKTDLEMQSVPLRLYDQQVKLFERQARQHRLEYEAMAALLQGDEARADNLMAELGQFSAQQAALAAEWRGQEQQMAMKGARNTAALAAMAAEMDALEEAFSLLTQSATVKGEAVTAHAEAEAKAGEQQVEIARAELENRSHEERLRLSQLRSELAQTLRQLALHLEQAKTGSAVRCGGARVYAGIANAMLSALNGIAIKSEEAYS